MLDHAPTLHLKETLPATSCDVQHAGWFLFSFMPEAIKSLNTRMPRFGDHLIFLKIECPFSCLFCLPEPCEECRNHCTREWCHSKCCTVHNNAKSFRAFYVIATSMSCCRLIFKLKNQMMLESHMSTVQFEFFGCAWNVQQHHHCNSAPNIFQMQQDGICNAPSLHCNFPLATLQHHTCLHQFQCHCLWHQTTKSSH